MSGATETEFFRRADMVDSKVGTADKEDAATAATTGFEAMMRGDSDVVSGVKNKVQSATANVSQPVFWRASIKMAEPGSAKSQTCSNSFSQEARARSERMLLGNNNPGNHV